ncbi:hypothetical protein B0H16DRAFT_1690616, partial [Mycena metata]
MPVFSKPCSISKMPLELLTDIWMYSNRSPVLLMRICHVSKSWSTARSIASLWDTLRTMLATAATSHFLDTELDGTALELLEARQIHRPLLPVQKVWLAYGRALAQSTAPWHPLEPLQVVSP